MPKSVRNAGGAGKKIVHTVKDTVNKVNGQNSPPDSAKAKILVKLVFASLALFSVIFFIVSRADFSPSAIISGINDKKILSQAQGKGYPAEIEGNRTLDFESASNGTAVLTDTNYMVFNDKGQQVVSNPHYMASPIMKIEGRYTLIYDQGNMSYSLKTLSGDVISGKSVYSLITADLSRSGRFVLVTNHETAFSEVSVYSKRGRLLHQWSTSNYCISAAAISPSGSHIALCGVTTKDGVMQSSVIIQKVGGNANLREYAFVDTLMLSVKFENSDNVTAIGDNLCVMMGVNSERQTKYDYSGNTLTGFDTDASGNVALVLSKHTDGKNCEVVLLDKKCKKVAQASTQLTSPQVDLSSGCINLVGEARLYSYNYDGRLVDESEIPADSQASVTSGGKTLVRGVTMITEVK